MDNRIILEDAIETVIKQEKEIEKLHGIIALQSVVGVIIMVMLIVRCL